MTCTLKPIQELIVVKRNKQLTSIISINSATKELL